MPGWSIGWASSTKRLETLFDYLPQATVTLDEGVTPQRDARWASIADQYDTRTHALSQKNRMDTVYKPAPPGLSYLDDAAWVAELAERRVMQFNTLKLPLDPASSTRADGSGATLRSSGNRKRSTFSARWPPM